MNLAEIIKSSSLPRPESELILAFLLKKRREEIIAHPEKIIRRQIVASFRRLEQKRLAHWPLAYLLKEKEFYGLKFRVNKNVLVPRPETENMVEYMINFISLFNPEKKLSQDKKEHGFKKKTAPNILQKISFIDVGTGSGAIIIALAKELSRLQPQLYAKSSWLAVDISPAALLLARRNAKNHGLAKKIIFKKSNLLAKVPKKFFAERQAIVAANLPYLTPAQTNQEKSISREPNLALIGGPDGLKYYCKLFRELSAKPLHSLFLIGEINPEQAEAVVNAATRYFSPKKNYRLDFLPDLSGRTRFFTITL